MIDAEQARDRQRSQPASTAGGAIPVPEVNLTPQEMIRRATAMRHTLRDRQAANEAEGRLLAQTNEEFINAGF